MSTVFPKLGVLNQNIVSTLEERAGNNLLVTNLMSWIRISSAVNGGMVLESIPKKINKDGNVINSSFQDSYGNERQSGRVGLNFAGEAVYADGADRGFRPSPVVESISIENGTSGLSRKAKFSIICYTLPQAELITKHFLEPAYTVLVEFGWNLPNSVGEKGVLSPCYMASFNSYTFVREKRTRSNGTYDGFMGFITGGSYASGEDETYIVDVELTTLGEIPSYLQVQKTAVNSTGDSSKEDRTAQTYPISEIESDGNDSKKIGQGLFKQTFNELPSEKRTQQIKNILNETDVNGNLFSSEWNFINVDESVREKFMEELGELLVTDETTNKEIEVEVPDGLQLFTDQSFIRLELAFRILNSYGLNIKPQINSNSNCTGDEAVTPSYDFSIGTNNTIIGAHKHMFSTDISKLYIPNTNLPDFGLDALLASSTEATADDFIDVQNPKIKNGNIWIKSGKPSAKKYEFPSTAPLVMEEDIKRLTDVRDVAAKPYTWGYLRNLYINLDFFIEVITRPNYVAKDCYYEILNGISSAANSYWQFEIQENVVKQEVPENSNTFFDVNQMEITDQNFVGDISKDVAMPMFEPSGPMTPFITSNINIDIPAAMKNSILGKRSSAKVETSIEGKDVEITRFFSDIKDPVMEILDSFKRTTNAQEEEAEEEQARQDFINEFGRNPFGDELRGKVKLNRNKATQNKVKPLPPDEARQRNLEEFAKRGTLLLTVRDKNLIDSSFFFGNNSVSIGDQVIVGAFDDPTLLKRFEVAFFTGRDTNGDGLSTNPSILAIEFTFETIGISGIKIGDTFKINQLPKQYSTGIFQVMETSHTLSDGFWKTSVSAKLRNV
jgi:hypothetical protein